MHQLFVISLYFLIALFVSSALLYNLERGEKFNENEMRWYRIDENGKLEPSPFQSIVHSLWWSIVTLTATGYGDLVPITVAGKIIAGITMISGILVIALLTSIIGSNFISEWASYRRIQFHPRLNEKVDNILKEFHSSKTKGFDILRNQNEEMLETIIEIQERLSEFNPQKCNKKHKNIQIRNIEELKKSKSWKLKLKKWKKLIAHESFYKI